MPEDWGKYFDSQNYAFWSDSEQCYVCYFRRFIKGMRGIARTTSQDFITWTPLVEMQANLPNEHLYTPCTVILAEEDGVTIAEHHSAEE